MNRKATPFYFRISSKLGPASDVYVPVNRAARKATPFYWDGERYVQSVALIQPQRGKWTEEQLEEPTLRENAKQRAKLARRKYV